MARPSVYDYLDYRSYLADMFTYRKQRAARFSYRHFSGKAGFASPNFLKLVIDGQRNITNDSIAKVAKGFGLKKKEREFFENLVFMNQAATHEEKNHYYSKIIAMAGAKRSVTIEKAQYDYFSKWYFPVVREMLFFEIGTDAAEKIAAKLTPRITVKEVQTTLETLEKLKLIERDDQGGWRQVHRDISTGPEIKSMIVSNFHKEMMRLASESIDRINASQRDISALTLSIPRDNVPEFKARVAAFRKELLALASAAENPDTVLQVNIQLFPLTT